MLATLTDAPFDGADWLFENKWDGVRIIANIERGKVTLYSRNGQVYNDIYLPVAKVLEKLARDAVLDGEMVALDEQGRSRFQLLQNAQRSRVSLRFMVFDIMFLDGVDLRDKPLIERKEQLRKVLPKHPMLSFSRHRRGKGVAFFEEATQQGEEGIIAKLADGRYLSGLRSKSWLKIKAGRRQEVVIAGFTAPQGSRQYFGALVMAVREGSGWRYIGHVGTGFSHRTLKELHAKLWPLRSSASPFSKRVKDELVTTWVKPKLVAEVRFTEWTSGGEMRHPVYLGLRTDKKPADVVLEREVQHPA